jgi:hypothetical protein
MKKQCQRLHIDHLLSSVSHPQLNSQTELTNKVLLNGLKNKITKAKSDWVELLNKILWAYRTTYKTFTRETLFLLTYEIEAIISVEIGCPNHRVIHYTS